MVMAKDGKALYSCDSNGDVVTWKANKKDKTYAPSKGECHALALSGDGKSLAVGYGDGAVVVVEPATGKEQRSAKVPDSVNALAFEGDNKTIAAGTQGEELQIIDGANAVTTKKGHSRPITAVAVAGDGRIVTASMDASVHVFAK
jgi:WD40 repeat protein